MYLIVRPEARIARRAIADWIRDRWDVPLEEVGVRGVRTTETLPWEAVRTVKTWWPVMADELKRQGIDTELNGLLYSARGDRYDITYDSASRTVTITPDFNIYHYEAWVVLSPSVRGRESLVAMNIRNRLDSMTFDLPSVHVDGMVCKYSGIAGYLHTPIDRLGWLRSLFRIPLEQWADALVVNVYDSNDRCALTMQLVDQMYKIDLSPEEPLPPPTPHPLLQANTKRSLAAYERMRKKRAARRERYIRFVKNRAKRVGNVAPLQCMAGNPQIVVDTANVAGTILYKSGGCTGCYLREPRHNVQQYLEGGRIPEPDAVNSCEVLAKGWRIGIPGLKKGDIVVPIGPRR